MALHRQWSICLSEHSHQLPAVYLLLKMVCCSKADKKFFSITCLWLAVLLVSRHPFVYWSKSFGKAECCNHKLKSGSRPTWYGGSEKQVFPGQCTSAVEEKCETPPPTILDLSPQGLDRDSRGHGRSSSRTKVTVAPILTSINPVEVLQGLLRMSKKNKKATKARYHQLSLESVLPNLLTTAIWLPAMQSVDF